VTETLTLENLRRLKETILESFLAFDELDKDEKSELDYDSLYQAVIGLKLLSGLTYNVEQRLGQFKVKGIEKVSLDIFDSDLYIVFGKSYHTIKSRILSRPQHSPFCEVEEILADVRIANDEDFLALELKVDSPALSACGISISPLKYDTYSYSTFSFCSNHLWFEPKADMCLDGNVAQINYAKGVRSMLEFFMQEKIPFALFANNASLFEPYIIGGRGQGTRAYRVNPSFPKNLETKVWLSVVTKMLPQYSI
jgi:hypothetical protein